MTGDSVRPSDTSQGSLCLWECSLRPSQHGPVERLSAQHTQRPHRLNIRRKKVSKVCLHKLQLFFSHHYSGFDPQ